MASINQYELQVLGDVSEDGALDINFGKLSESQQSAIMHALLANNDFKNQVIENKKLGERHTFYLVKCESEKVAGDAGGVDALGVSDAEDDLEKQQQFTVHISFDRKTVKQFSVNISDDAKTVQELHGNNYDFPEAYVDTLHCGFYLKAVGKGDDRRSVLDFYSNSKIILDFLTIAMDKNKTPEEKWNAIIKKQQTATWYYRLDQKNTFYERFDLLNKIIGLYPDLLYLLPKHFAFLDGYLNFSDEDKDKKQNLRNIIDALFEEHKYDVATVVDKIILSTMPEKQQEITFDKEGQSKLEKARPENYFENSTVALLLIKKFAQDQAMNKHLWENIDPGYTPLHRAIMNDNEKIAVALAKHYPKEALFALDACGNSVLHLACFYRQFDMINAIAQRAKELGVEDELFEQKNSHGYTPVQCLKAEKRSYDDFGGLEFRQVSSINFRGKEVESSAGPFFTLSSFVSQGPVFSQLILSDLVMNDNKEYPYPLKQNIVARSSTIGALNKKLPTALAKKPAINLNFDHLTLFDLNKKAFETSKEKVLKQATADELTVKNNEVFAKSEYGRYLQKNVFVRIEDELKNGHSKSTAESIMKAEAELYTLINDVLKKEQPTKMDEKITEQINTALLKKIDEDILKRKEIKQQPAAVALFKGLFGVIFAAVFIFLPMISKKYRSYFFNSSQKHAFNAGAIDLRSYEKDHRLVPALVKA